MNNFRYVFYSYDQIEEILKTNILQLDIESHLRNDFDFKTDRIVTLYLMDKAKKPIDVSASVVVESNPLGKKIITKTQLKFILDFLKRNSFNDLIEQIEKCKMSGFDSQI